MEIIIAVLLSFFSLAPCPTSTGGKFLQVIQMMFGAEATPTTFISKHELKEIPRVGGTSLVNSPIHLH